jgi:DNA-binding response OmpR family regulator
MPTCRTPSVDHRDLSVDWCVGAVSTSAGRVVLLRTELRLLGFLLATDGATVERRALVRGIWPEAAMDITRFALLQVYVRSLRRRLAVIGAGNLLSVHGARYRVRLQPTGGLPTM